MWRELVGTMGYLAGSAGTATVPKGASVLRIVVVGGAGAGSFTLFGGASIPVPAGVAMTFAFNHTNWQSQNDSAVAGSQDVVFTSTGSYFVEYVKAGNT